MLFMQTMVVMARDGRGFNPMTPEKKPTANASTSMFSRSAFAGAALTIALNIAMCGQAKQ
jgi:hypothetical protein